MDITVKTHWECECGSGYVWPKNVEKCPICCYEHDECPDARASEMGDFRPAMNESDIVEKG